MSIQRGIHGGELMDRNSMLNRFSKLRYCVLWPGIWDDIGFTERPIWVCREGYGYFYDDEPCSFTTIEGVTQAQVKELKEKLSHGQLNVEDIEGSPFESINVFDDTDYLAARLEDFAGLPDSFSERIYCGEDTGGWTFFNSEAALIDAFAKDSDDYNFVEKWADMNDEHLLVWYERLFVEQLDLCLPMTMDILDE